MNPRQAFFLQGVLEAAIPVYGYLEWNWDLSFILLFYFIDWLLSLSLTWFKGRKRYAFSGEEQESALLTRKLLLSCAIAAVATLLFAFATVNVKPGMSWTQRIADFLLYKDMGIQQGIIILPLMVLNGILLYRQQFLTPKLFEKLTMNAIVQPVLAQNLLLLAAGGVFYGLTSLLTVSETITVFVLIAAITAYRTFFVRSVLSYTTR